MSGRKSKANSPLVEVSCEFAFEQAPDPQGMERFWRGKFKEAYPLALDRIGTPLRDRFLAANEKTILLVGEASLLVGQLPPFHTWQRFEKAVKEAFAAYCRAWEVSRIARASLHYVDKFDIPAAEFDLSRYFNLYPARPDFPPGPATDVSLSLLLNGTKEEDSVKISLQQYDSADPDGTTFWLDRMYVSERGPAPELGAVRAWLAETHGFLDRLLNSTITDECRRLFE